MFYFSVADSLTCVRLVTPVLTSNLQRSFTLQCLHSDEKGNPRLIFCSLVSMYCRAHLPLNLLSGLKKNQ